MDEAGRRRAEQQFSPQRMCADMVEVYRDVLGEARATARAQSHCAGNANTNTRINSRQPRPTLRPPTPDLIAGPDDLWGASPALVYRS